MSEGGAMHYVVLEPDLVPHAVQFYTKIFQVTTKLEYDDGSVKLKINDSHVLVTPGISFNSIVLELVLDRGSLQTIREDQSFVEIDRGGVNFLQDPFGVFWLFTEFQKDSSDIYRHIDHCELMLFETLEADKTFHTYRSLQKVMSEIREVRFLYECKDFVLFTNHPTLRVTFDELERVNSFMQALSVTLFFNPTMIGDVSSLDVLIYHVNLHVNSVIEKIGLSDSDNPVDHPAVLRVRSKLADSFRQLLKRMQSTRQVFIKKSLGLTNDDPWDPPLQVKWMDEVEYWRTQYY